MALGPSGPAPLRYAVQNRQSCRFCRTRGLEPTPETKKRMAPRGGHSLFWLGD